MGDQVKLFTREELKSRNKRTDAVLIIHNGVYDVTKFLDEAHYVTKAPKPEIPKNPLNEIYSASAQKDNGVIYDKKPFKLTLKEGKVYHWCLCGRSKSQPLCDGTHKDVFLKVTQRPIRFTVEKTKDYWLCNCKQTKNRPFCDGTHKQKDIQETAVRV